jgi:hypothetical protein
MMKKTIDRLLSPNIVYKMNHFFTKDDHAKNLLEEVSVIKVQETRKLNIGTEISLKYANLGVDCTTKEVDQYVSLFKEYIDVFTWTYDYLKAHDKAIFQHIITLREEAKTVKKKIRMMNPKMKSLVNIELEKLKKERIIYPIRHSDWLSNPVIARKKMREIRMCVDFRDLNKESIKDNFTLPNTWNSFSYKLLDQTACPCWIVFLDITKSWWSRNIGKRQHLSHHGRHMDMLECPLV